MWPRGSKLTWRGNQGRKLGKMLEWGKQEAGSMEVVKGTVVAKGKVGVEEWNCGVLKRKGADGEWEGDGGEGEGG